MRPRLLPATIVVGGLLLVSKSTGVGLAYVPGAWTLRQVVVPVAEAAAPPEKAHGGEAARPPAAPAPTPVAKASTPKPALPSDPPQPVISAEERQLLQDLRARRQEWDARDRTLTQREGVLSAAEQRLVTRAGELADLQARLEQLERSRVRAG